MKQRDLHLIQIMLIRLVMSQPEPSSFGDTMRFPARSTPSTLAMYAPPIVIQISHHMCALLHN